MPREEPSSDFAGNDDTDGRAPGNWWSTYPLEAQKEIRFDAWLVGGYFLVSLLLVFLCVMDCHPHWIPVDCDTSGVVGSLVCSFVGGVFGGALFSMKWLYHSVARQKWNLDRRLWRIFTPLISGGLAMMMVMLVSSNILRIFDKDAISNRLSILAFASLVGYFSDSAAGKLAELAQTLFGVNQESRSRKKS